MHWPLGALNMNKACQKGIRSEGVNGSEGRQWIKQTLYLHADILAIILILVRVTQ